MALVRYLHPIEPTLLSPWYFYNLHKLSWVRFCQSALMKCSIDAPDNRLYPTSINSYPMTTPECDNLAA